MLEKNKVKQDTIELVANQIYDKITKLFNERRERLGIKGGDKIVEPITYYNSFTLDDIGKLTFTYKNEVIGLGNINKGLLSPSKMIRELGVKRLKLMSYKNTTEEDINPYRRKYKDAREKVINEKSKIIQSSSITDAEAIEMIEMTSKDINKTIKGVEQDTSFIKPNDKDKLLPLRELIRGTR